MLKNFLLPTIVILAELLEGLLLVTVHVYSPLVSIVRVCMYSAVTRSIIKDIDPPVTVVESLVQLTAVAGPPVEMQVTIFMLES